ncbi:hypothetical protein Tco_0765607 [Tanacetum coccineum]
MKIQNPLLKDEDGEEVDVHMYRSMIGSLMHLTSLRHDIIFAVCACARYQVNPKVSHLHAMKMIFRWADARNRHGKVKKSVRLMMEKLFGMELELILVKTINGEVQLHALVDGKKIIITESTVRRDLQLEDAEGIDCLPNSTILEQLALLSAKTTTWNEYSSTMASAIIYLATNQKFNFSKYIFESMVKNLDNVSGNFLMYPRFVQVFVNQQLDGMPTLKRIYDAPFHIKKIFGNMKRVGKGSAILTDPHHTPTIIQSSTQPQKTQKPRKPKRKDTQVPQPSGPTDIVADEAVHKELGDRLVRAATTASSLEADQDSDKDITLVNVQDDADNELFDVNTLTGDEVLAEQEVAAKDVNLTVDEVTLAQALAALKSAKPKVKGDVIEEPSVPVSTASASTKVCAATTTATILTLKKGIVITELGTPIITRSSQQPSQAKVQDKGKGKMVEPEKPMKKKDQISFDEETAKRLQAEFDEEARLAREKAEKEQEANVALTEEWDDIQAKIEADHELAQILQA